MEAKRGGARPGAGRPKSEPTTMVRVPDGCLEAVRHLISVYRDTGTLPFSEPCGDSHKQVDLPLSSPAKTATRSNPVADAWEVFWDLRCSRQGVHLLEENYFKLAKATNTDYSYLFMLQLLQRLFDLPVPWNSCAPVEWIQFKALRTFTDKLYKANPQWH